MSLGLDYLHVREKLEADKSQAQRDMKLYLQINSCPLPEFQLFQIKFQRFSTVDLFDCSTCGHPRSGCDALNARKMAKLKLRRDGGSGCW